MNWQAYAAGTGYTWQSEPVTRGYTFHEQLDPVGLVHMNGRVYDPEIGRFLSADPFIQDVTNSQSLNSYTYVNNNPLSFTDPSGFFLKDLFKAIGKFVKAIGRAFKAAVKSIVRSQIGRAILQIAACTFGGPKGCIAAAAALTLAAGGTIKEAIVSAAISFTQIGAYTTIGGIVSNVASIAGDIAAGAVKLATHAVVGGAFAMSQGGSFEAGALAGAVSAGSTLLSVSAGLTDKTIEGFVGGTVVAAVAGGTASSLTGGKFANGAITGAMGHIFNYARKVLPNQKQALALPSGGGGAPPSINVFAAVSAAIYDLVYGPADVGSGDSQDRFRLYRAVSPVEFDDIQECQCFRAGPNSYEGKLFAKELVGAEFFLKTLPDATNIVGATVDSSVYNSLYHFNPDGIPSVAVDRDMLPPFNASVTKNGGPWVVK